MQICYPCISIVVVSGAGVHFGCCCPSSRLYDTKALCLLLRAGGGGGVVVSMLDRPWKILNQ
jgi:hypothetical protein